jgi:2-polyprenyl-6-hydroxyphenyl methylase / 3-demethylubiquinone-9 3-methyltransferase
MSGPAANADAAEVTRFNALASRWWDPAGEMRPLHQMNPVRVAFIAARAALPGARCLDVGCGGGLLSEALARAGATVTGIDLAADSLEVARLHQAESGLAGIRYLRSTAEDLGATEAGAYDVVTCLEVLEHVPDPASTIAACARLVRPGGDVFFSTINRNAAAYLVTVVGAEYLLGILPRGTHDYARFIRPSELDGWARQAGLELLDLAGLEPEGRGGFRLGASVRVNYIAHCRAAPR